MIEDSIIQKITDLLNSVYDEHGIMVDDFQVTWINLDTAEKPLKRVEHVRAQFSKSPIIK